MPGAFHFPRSNSFTVNHMSSSGNTPSGEHTEELRRRVKGPNGQTYLVTAIPKDWNLGTGSLLLDLAQFVRGLVRQARGKEWVVSVRGIEARGRPLTTRRVRTREDAVATVDEIAEAIETGAFELES
jgi:hypothetical protein